MPVRPHPPGYHCSKAMRRLGLRTEVITSSLRKRLGLDTGEIAEVLAYPVTPPDGVAMAIATTGELDLTDLIDARDEPEAHTEQGAQRWARALLAASESPKPSV